MATKKKAARRGKKTVGASEKAHEHRVLNEAHEQRVLNAGALALQALPLDGRKRVLSAWLVAFFPARVAFYGDRQYARRAAAIAKRTK